MKDKSVLDRKAGDIQVACPCRAAAQQTGNCCIFERAYRKQRLRRAMAVYLSHPPGLREQEAAKVLQVESSLLRGHCEDASHKRPIPSPPQVEADRHPERPDLSSWHFSHRIQ